MPFQGKGGMCHCVPALSSTYPPALAACTCRSARAPVSHLELSHTNTPLLPHPPTLPACCLHIVPPPILLQTTICTMSHSLLPPVSLIVRLVACQSSLLYASLRNAKQRGPRVCQKLQPAVFSVRSHWSQLQGFAVVC